METKDYIAIGGIAVVAIAIVAIFGKSTSTGYAVDPNAAKAEASIVAANSNAINAGVAERTTYATLAAQTAQTHDTNTAAIAIAANNGATQVQLAHIASDMNKTIAQTQSLAAERIAQIEGATQTTIASTNAVAQQTVAMANANANTTVANDAKDAANHASDNNLFGSIVGGIASVVPFFSGGSGQYKPTNSVADLANLIPVPSVATPANLPVPSSVEYV